MIKVHSGIAAKAHKTKVEHGRLACSQNVVIMLTVSKERGGEVERLAKTRLSGFRESGGSRFAPSFTRLSFLR